jgi:hypothetical protein
MLGNKQSANLRRLLQPGFSFCTVEIYLNQGRQRFSKQSQTGYPEKSFTQIY